MVLTHTLPSTTYQKTQSSRLGEFPPGIKPSYRVRVAEQTSSLIGDETPTQIKTKLYQALQGINRGIFGVPSAKKSEIEGLVKQPESLNPTPDPTLNLEKRVDISYDNSTITPVQLMNVFRKNYDILLGIFNPDGVRRYVDDTMRIGRDDKGNIFILERSEEI